MTRCNVRIYLLIILTCIGAFAADDPSKLLEKAKKHQSKREFASAIHLAKKADGVWSKTDPNAAERAEALTVLSLCRLGSDQINNAGLGMSHEAILASWENEVSGYLSKGTEIARTNPGVKPEVMALLLELQSLEPRNQEGAPMLRKEANEIHKKLAEGLLPMPPPSATMRGVHIGGDVHPPQIISKVEPEYSEAARVIKFSGTTLFQIIVDADGVPAGARILRPIGFGLDEQAVLAVKKWRFKPSEKDGTPVAVIAHVEVSFRLL